MKVKRKLRIWKLVFLAYALLLVGILTYVLLELYDPNAAAPAASTDAPPTESIASDAPATEAPQTAAPSTDAPATQAPTDPAPTVTPPPERAPVLALTFDDGPSPNTTAELVGALNERGARATFFMLGVNAAAYPKLVQFVAESGHQVASHGWDHANYLTELSDSQLQDELSRANDAIYQAIEQYPAYLRPPYGAIDLATAAKIDMPLMLWTIDPRDWEVRDSQSVCDNIVNNAYDGGVVIAHDNYQSTLDGVLCAVDILAEQGYQFVTLEEYYQIFNIEPQPGVVYRGASTADID